ncbi:DUF2007 domain-containing protein [Flavobacteriaceae bacterium GSB9]|nr:DUF2007 domain-containing protein [Flavobacteriaceae bacterium GSB9]
MSNYIKVFSGNFNEVQHIFSELEKINICAIIKDESESARLAGFGYPGRRLQEIHVHKDELKRALPLVEELTSELKE